MQTRSWFNRVNEALGFHNDERVQQVHGNAVRTAYLLMAAATVPFGVYLQYAWQQPGALWAALVILAASLLVFLVRRVQLNGFAAADERMVRLRQNVFAWPVITLVAGMYGYAMYHTFVFGDMRAMQILPLSILLGVFAVMIARALNRTAQGNALYWLVVGLFMFALVGWNAWTIPLSTLNGLALAALVGLVVYGVICQLTAWRRWQEQRAERRG